MVEKTCAMQEAAVGWLQSYGVHAKYKPREFQVFNPLSFFSLASCLVADKKGEKNGFVPWGGGTEHG